MTRMSNDAFPQNRSTFDGLVKATIIVGAIVAAVLITMTIAGANVVRPVQLVADGSEPPDAEASASAKMLTMRDRIVSANSSRRKF